MTKRWYVLHTYSGYEKKVKTDLESRIENMGLHDVVSEVVVPMEHVVEIKDGGKKKDKDVNVFPGYVLVRMEMDDHAWFMIRNTPKVTGFLGSSGGGTKPVPVPTDEMDRILSKLGMVVKPKAEFSVGDKIVVTSGPFKDYTFDVAEIDEAKSIVVVFADLLGSAVRTELSFDEVKKI